MKSQLIVRNKASPEGTAMRRPIFKLVAIEEFVPKAILATEYRGKL